MKSALRLIYLLVIVLTFVACGSSKHVTHTSGGKSSSQSRHQIDYKSMRDHVSAMSFDDDIVSRIIGSAVSWIGTPYRYAGTSRDGVDCSGLMQEVFKESTGMVLPRNSAAQQAWCMPVEGDTLRPGDLLFFATGSDKERVSHVGLYIGGDEMIHASSSRGVIVSQLRLPYYVNRFHSAGRPQMLYERNRQVAVEILPDSVPQPVEIDLDSLINEAVIESFNDFFD